MFKRTFSTMHTTTINKIDAEADEYEAQAQLESLYESHDISLDDISTRPEKLELALTFYSNSRKDMKAIDEYEFSEEERKDRYDDTEYRCSCSYHDLKRWRYAVHRDNGNVLRVGLECYRKLLPEQGQDVNLHGFVVEDDAVEYEESSSSVEEDDLDFEGKVLVTGPRRKRARYGEEEVPLQTSLRTVLDLTEEDSCEGTPEQPDYTSDEELLRALRHQGKELIASMEEHFAEARVLHV